MKPMETNFDMLEQIINKLENIYLLISKVASFASLTISADSKNAEGRKYLDIINKETVRINDLIQGMLRLSRLEAGKVELNKEVLDLEDIVTEVIDEFEVLELTGVKFGLHFALFI